MQYVLKSCGLFGVLNIRHFSGWNSICNFVSIVGELLNLTEVSHRYDYDQDSLGACCLLDANVMIMNDNDSVHFLESRIFANI